MLTLRTMWTKDNARKITIHREDWTIDVYLRPLTGGDQRAISESKEDAGRESICRSIVYLDGVVLDDGTPVRQLDADTYALMPQDALTTIAREIADMNGLTEAQAGE